MKTHPIKSDTLNTLNQGLIRGVGESLIISLLENGVILEGLSDKGMGHVVKLCFIRKETEALRTLLRAQYLPIIASGENDLLTELEQKETLANDLKEDIAAYKNTLGDAAIQAYQKLGRDLGREGDPIRRAIKMDEMA